VPQALIGKNQCTLLDFVSPGSVSLHQRRKEVIFLLNQFLHLSEENPASIYAEFNPKKPMVIFAAYIATLHDSVLTLERITEGAVYMTQDVLSRDFHLIGSM
jgi:hypothetical protein